MHNLLTPRFKVIAPYPQSFWQREAENKIQVGDIFMQLMANQSIWRKFKNNKFTDDTVHFIEEYPNIFKPLEWWEERKIEEMPEYVKKDPEYQTSTLSIGDDSEPEIHKIKRQFATSMDAHSRYSDRNCFISEWLSTSYSYCGFLPATEAEYNEFINRK